MGEGGESHSNKFFSFEELQVWSSVRYEFIKGKEHSLWWVDCIELFWGPLVLCMLATTCGYFCFTSLISNIQQTNKIETSLDPFAPWDEVSETCITPDISN